MGDVLGLDFLTNPKMTDAPDMKMANLDSIDLPSINLDIGGSNDNAPKLMPSFDEVGPMKTSEGLENLNAQPFFSSGPPKRMSEEHLMKEKYELLRKFERLSKLGVPLRKRFTMDSPIDEMKMELEFIKREKEMDNSIKQFSEWFVTGMSAMEWSSKNVAIMKAFGLQLDGLSESAQMNVVDMEEDFEELYELYGDKIKMHPLVRIPIRTCMMIYMVHLTNQMARKAPIPNIDEVMRSNPDIARQLASAAMQQQTQSMRQQAQQQPSVIAPPPQMSNPLSGLASFMSGMIPPAPPQQMSAPKMPTSVRPAIRYPKPNPQPPMAAVAPPPAPAREMRPPALNIDELLRKVNGDESKKVSTVNKKGGSTGKNSVSIKL